MAMQMTGTMDQGAEDGGSGRDEIDSARQNGLESVVAVWRLLRQDARLSCSVEQPLIGQY